MFSLADVKIQRWKLMCAPILLILVSISMFLHTISEYRSCQFYCFFLISALYLSMFIEAFIKRNKTLILFCVFTSLYFLIARHQLFQGIPITIRHDFYSEKIFSEVLIIHCVFISAMFIFWRPAKVVTLDLRRYSNNFIWLFCIVVCIIIFFIGQRGQLLINGGTYGSELETSTLNDYVVLFFFCAYKFSGSSRRKHILLNIIIVSFILKALLLGSRSGMIFIGLFIFNLDWHKRVSFLQFLVLILLAYLSMTILETVRQNPLLLLSGNITDMLGLHEDKEFIYNNQSDVFYASMRIVGLIETGYLSFTSRILSASLFLVSVFVPYSILPPLSNLSSFMSEMFTTGGGGLISSYFFAFGGYLGSFAIGAFISIVASGYGRFKDEYWSTYSIFILSQVGTWFAYNPIGLFKLCGYSCLLLFIFKYLHSLMLNKQFK